MSSNKQDDNQPEVKTEPTTTTTVTYASATYAKGVRNCHVATEVYPGLVLGSYAQHKDMVTVFNCNVLVPLNDLDGDIWSTGFRGQIYYVPITDFGIMPRDVAINKAKKVAKMVKQGRRVGVFCIGGHGRTGYFASLVLGYLGVDDPIAVVRAYCAETIETKKQIKEIVEILGKPELAMYEPPVKNYTYYSSFVSADTTKDKEYECQDCGYFELPEGKMVMGNCWLVANKPVDKYSFAIPCKKFAHWSLFLDITADDEPTGEGGVIVDVEI